MPDTEPTSARLEALRARWEADKASRVFLQLADEYRRLGRSADAAEVLEEGLEANPTHPAARVALGRCRLDLGQAAEAITELETVIGTDPTQMVAYRLLVDAYLREGRADLARQRLRVYALLNDSDPEIADLRRRIGEIDRQGGESPASPLPPPPPQAAAGAELPEEPERVSEPPPPPPEAAPAPPPVESEPFPTLVAAEGDRRRYSSALAEGEVFALPMPPEAAKVPGAAPVELSEEIPETTTVRRPDVFEIETPAASPPADLSSLLEQEPALPAEEAEPEAAAPAEPSGQAEGTEGTETPPALATVEPEESLEPADVAPPHLEEPKEGAGRPTVTLGRLYLRQGHLSEAEAIFQEILEREPGNAEAKQGLEELAARRRPELRASELLGDSAAEGSGEGLTDRKRHMLERYLERLRRRAPGDVH